MKRRWEVVARLHTRDQSWVVPISVGRMPYRTRLGAWWGARRLNRSGMGDLTVLPMTWETRRL